MEKYYDKNGKEIKEGMTIKHDDGDLEKVYASDDSLGLNASNENHKNFEPMFRKLYPLHQFNLKEWEIVEEGA